MQPHLPLPLFRANIRRKLIWVYRTGTTAEESRVMAVKQKAEGEAQAQATAERKAAKERAAKARVYAEAEARGRAEAEAARTQAETARSQAEAAKADAERSKLEAQQASQEAARQKQEAEQAKAEAIAQQRALTVEADRARQAAAQSDLLRQQAEKEKQELRARLLQQLNIVLSTRDSARGLIANMSDVLFKSGNFELLTAARERLAKVSGIVLAYPSLHSAVEGHTDSVGSDEYNRHSRNAVPRRCAIIWSSREFLRTRSQPAASGRRSRWRRMTRPKSSTKSQRRTRTLGRGNWQGNGG